MLLFAPLFGAESMLASVGDIRLVLLYGAAFFYIGSTMLVTRGASEG